MDATPPSSRDQSIGVVDQQLKFEESSHLMAKITRAGLVNQGRSTH